MKKIFMVAALMIATVSASAQIWMGGDLGFRSADGQDSRFNIMPTVGYQINDNWDVAIRVGYTKWGGAGTFTIAPFARYTFAQLDAVSFFVDGGLDFDFFDGGNDFWVGLRPGVKFAASDKISFVATLGNLGYQKSTKSIVLGIQNTDLSFGMYWSF